MDIELDTGVVSDFASRIKMKTPVVYKQLNALVVNPEVAIWTPAAGKKFRLLGFYFAQGVATGIVVLKDGVAGTTILTLPPHPIGTVMPLLLLPTGILSAAVNNVLTATGIATETLTGFVFGTEE